MIRSQPSMHLSLDPDAVHLASRAYDAALQSIGEGTFVISAYAVRQELARAIIEHVGRGEANIEVLMRLALQHLSGRRSGTESLSPYAKVACHPERRAVRRAGLHVTADEKAALVSHNATSTDQK